MEIGACMVMAGDFGGWPEYLTLMEKCGIRAVELWDTPEHLPREASRSRLLTTLLRSRGVRAVSVHGPARAKWDCSSPDKDVRDGSVRECAGSLERTASLGAEFMVYHLSYEMEEEKERPERKKWAQDSLARLVRRAEKLAVKLAVENLLPRFVGWNKTELEEIAGPFLGQTVGICFDTGHVHASGLSMDAFDSWWNNLLSFHVHDNDGISDQHLFPGEGRFDWAALGRKLVEIGYSGPLMLECKLPQEENVVEKMKALLRI